MSEIKNDRFLRALKRESVDRTPIWIMRQAGRYLPEYRITRGKAGDFLSLCKNKQLCCEVALQPLKRFELDAAILFSDILTIPDAMGLGLYFETGEGPKFRKTIKNYADVEKLPQISIRKDLSYVLEAVSLIRYELNNQLPLIGFSGSPWTLAAYMIEGQGSKNFPKAKAMRYQDPALLHLLLQKITTCVIDYLNAQIEHGVQVVQIFDSWGGLLSHDSYFEFSLSYMSQIIKGIKDLHGDNIPIILYTKGGGQWISDIADTNCDCIGIDWTTNIGTARKKVGNVVSIQGNLDPSVLLSDKRIIRSEVSKIMESFGSYPGHIFNLGHGITPDVKPENVNEMIMAVHDFTQKSNR